MKTLIKYAISHWASTASRQTMQTGESLESALSKNIYSLDSQFRIEAKGTKYSRNLWDHKEELFQVLEIEFKEGIILQKVKDKEIIFQALEGHNW